MDVERCPDCGARYNVTALEDGRAFRCRRCGGRVVVGSSVEEPPASRRSVALVVVGLLMLLSLFLRAHPTIGWRDAAMPWTHWARVDSVVERADLVLWTVVAVLAVVAGAGGLGRAGAVLVLAGAAVLAVRSHSLPPAFEMARGSLAGTVATVALGAGFVASASRRAPANAASSWLLLGGALATLAVLGVPSPGEGQGFLVREVARLPAALRDEIPADELWSTHAPFLAHAAAVVLGLAAAVLPRGALVARFSSALGFACLLLTWLFPLAALSARTWTEISDSARQASQTASRAWFSEGLALFLLGAVAVAALVARRAESPAAPRAATAAT